MKRTEDGITGFYILMDDLSKEGSYFLARGPPSSNNFKRGMGRLMGSAKNKRTPFALLRTDMVFQRQKHRYLIHCQLEIYAFDTMINDMHHFCNFTICRGMNFMPNRHKNIWRNVGSSLCLSEVCVHICFKLMI